MRDGFAILSHSRLESPPFISLEKQPVVCTLKQPHYLTGYGKGIARFPHGTFHCKEWIQTGSEVAGKR
jgi:hypothetical protein